MDGPPPPEEDFSTIPIADRLAHKNWKARVSAYESLIKTFQNTASDTDPAFRPYTSNPDILKKIATDANAVAQEKGVECIVAFVKFAGETAARTRETVLPAIVEKGFGSTRAGTKAHSLELLLQYVEVENGGAGVVGDILPGLSAKQPKAVAGSVTALREIVRVFGTQATPPPPILKALPKIFAHADKTVRAEGSILAQTLYQYLGPGIESWLSDLKPVQVKELKESFEALEKDGKGKGTLKPERMTRAQAREAEAAGDDPAGEEDAAAEEADAADLDPRAFAEPVDIVPKIPGSFQAMLTSSKWKERKEVLDELLTVLNSTPRIQEASELGEIARSLAVRVQGDANINCVMTAANCLEALAKGLGAPFSRYRETVVPSILERLKERKASVADTIGNALDAVFSTTTLPDIIPDLGSALSHKNPQVKEGTLKFLARCLSTSKTPIQPPQIKPLAETLTGLLEDPFEGARNEAATCLGTLMKMVGERPLNAVIEGVADVRKAKIKEAFEKATVKAKAGAGPPPRAAGPPPSAASAPAAKRKVASKPAPVITEDGLPAVAAPPPAKKPVAKPPARLMDKKSAPAAAPAPKKPAVAAGPAKPAKAAAPAAPGALDTFKYKHTSEDAEALAADIIPSSMLADFADANWKTRLAACEALTTWLEESAGEVDAEVVVRALAKKGWSEKNFQISAKLYGILSLLAERSPSFGRSCVALSVGHLSEKLGDMKLKKPAGDTLTVFAEKTSLQFVLNQAYDPLSKQKAPKVLADAIAWVDAALKEFGIAGLSLRSLIDFLKTGLGNSNATVRTSATKALVTLKLFAGPSIKDLIQDLNAQLLATITSEFDKVEGTPAPEPTRSSADLASMPDASSSKGGAAGGDALDDLFPRIEIDSLLKGTTILVDAKSDAWKTKKEALESLQGLLDQPNAKRLKPNMGEIAQVLKARVTDTNKAVQSLALDIVSRIATGMGKPFEKQTRFFVGPVATVLSDQKAPIRAIAIQTLTAIATACEGLEPMVPGIASGLESTNPLQKGSLVTWITGWITEHPPSSTLDLSTWALPIVSSLDDRNGDVRKGAQSLLPTLITYAGYDYVMQQSNSLKPASRTSAVPLIQAARGQAAPEPAPKAAPSKPTNSKPATTLVDTVPPSSPSPVPETPGPVAGPSKSATKLTGIRRKLPIGSSRPDSRAESVTDGIPPRVLKAPATALRPSASSKPSSGQSTPPTLGFVFTGTNPDARKARLGRDASKWIIESGHTRKDLVESLHSQMEGPGSKELVSKLFSHDHNAINDYITGLSMLQDLYGGALENDDPLTAVCLANFDFPLRYVSVRVQEPQSNLVMKCLDVVEAVVSFLRQHNYQLTDAEATCFVPTIIHKLGDAREQVRFRVQQVVQSLPHVYAFSRVFQLLLEHGLKSKVSKTRQGALDEMAAILKKSGMGACDPAKAFPVIASMISDKDSQVRRSALSVLSEGYSLIGEKVWSYVGSLPPKDKTQLEERLRRVAGPSTHASATAPPPAQVMRLAMGISRPASPATRMTALPRASSPTGGPRSTGLPRPMSPAMAAPSKLARPASPIRPARSFSPTNAPTEQAAPVAPTSPQRSIRPKSMLPSRLARPRSNFSVPSMPPEDPQPPPSPIRAKTNGHHPTPSMENGRRSESQAGTAPTEDSDDVTIVISSILSSDPSRSVDALKKIQKILSMGSDAGPASPAYQELAEHTEGLVETITLQMAHVFERPEDLVPEENFRLAKHLIQTLNNFCDHSYLAESLTVDILTSLLEELTLRLLETDDSPTKKVKDLSRFINMIILRLFATGRRMSIFRALFALLLQIVKPFPSTGAQADSKEAKIAELVLKCVWKLARNIPQDLNDQKLDPVELFPAIEHFLQTVPPNEWRARATNKVPCGDMPLRTIKVIIQHVVAHYGDEVYDLLSASFDDPSATIVYPYVYRILNSAGRSAEQPAALTRNGQVPSRTLSPSSRPVSPPETAMSASPSMPHRDPSPSHRTSASSLQSPKPMSPTEEDPDAQLLTIIGHISSETTGALHKEGITELHQFLKAHPNKRPRVEKMLESTGAAFRKYINRALASRAAEDQESGVATADPSTKLDSNHTPVEASPQLPHSPRRSSPPPVPPEAQERLSRLHDIFQYRSSTVSNGSSQGRSTPAPRTSFS